MFHLIPELCHCATETVHLLRLLFEEVQHEPQGGFFPNARQFGKFGYGILKQLGGKVVGIHWHNNIFPKVATTCDISIPTCQ
jgi:hypothetical protein